MIVSQTRAASSWFGTGWTGGQSDLSSINSTSIQKLAAAGSYALTSDSFGFAIPSGATINGILAQVVAKKSTGTASGTSLTLENSSGPNTINKWAVPIVLTSSYTLYEAGGQGDLWTPTVPWTVDEINASTFAAAILLTYASTATVQIDYLALTVYYEMVEYSGKRQANQRNSKNARTMPFVKNAIGRITCLRHGVQSFFPSGRTMLTPLERLLRLRAALALLKFQTQADHLPQS